MVRNILNSVLAVALMGSLLLGESWGRGFGGGGFGGAGRSFGGAGGLGGFSGAAGAGRSLGGLGAAGGFGGAVGGAARSPGGFGGGEFGGIGAPGAGRSPGGYGGPEVGGFGGAGRNPGGFGGAGNAGRTPGAFQGPEVGGFGGAGRNPGEFGGAGTGGFGGEAPNRSQLDNFLGLPSDGGMHNLGSANGNNFGREANFNNFDRADNFDVNRGAIEGPRGGAAAGGSVTGPRGNTAYRGAAVGPYGGAVAGRGVEGARGAAGGFVAVSPSGRYAAATAVRGNFHSYGLYRTGWYTAHPGAWYATGWAAGAAWRAATWNTVGDWFAYDAVQPIYYDYGNNVTYQENNVYVNGQPAGTSQEYYDQAESLATAGSTAEASNEGDWLPLGVFALSQNGQNSSNMVIQLAVNRAGVIRGNFTDTNSTSSQTVQGSVDKQTQRAAWTIGDNKNTVIETGIYNLTKDEAPALVHFGADRTEQWLLVRLRQDEQEQPGQ